MLHPQLFCQETIKKGKGIFTRITLLSGEIIEVSPVLVMNYEDRIHLDKTALHDYIFEWKANGEDRVCVAWGYLSLYNHSYKSNAEYCMDYENNTMSITTVRSIEAGEEITINYNGDWDDEKKIWFAIAEEEV